MAEEIKQEETITSDSVIEASENMVETSGDMDEENISKAQEVTESHEPKKIENLEKALRVFKRKSAGIISEVRKREAYDSPSVKRKKKSKEARRKRKMGYKFGNRYQ